MSPPDRGSSADRASPGETGDDDETTEQIAQRLRERDVTNWVVELRSPGGAADRGFRLAITGNGRVSRWNDPNAEGPPDDTLVLPRDKVLSLFASFEQAGFATLPSSGGAGGNDLLPTTLAFTRDDKTVVVTRTAGAEPQFEALVKLTRQVGDIAALPHSTDDCRWTAGCKTSGLCSAQGNRCVAGSNVDCQSARPCQVDGVCTAQAGACVVGSDADCTASSGCREDGRCRATAGKCVASAPGCKASAACGADGLCSMAEGRCVASMAADCRASDGCRASGRCSVRDRACVVATDADCRVSEACTQDDRCMARCDRCVKSPDEACEKVDSPVGGDRADAALP